MPLSCFIDPVHEVERTIHMCEPTVLGRLYTCVWWGFGHGMKARWYKSHYWLTQSMKERVKRLSQSGWEGYVATVYTANNSGSAPNQSPVH